jgi:hypothetical protein
MYLRLAVIPFAGVFVTALTNHTLMGRTARRSKSRGF